jgi:superfamily II DNA or RNA helicase
MAVALRQLSDLHDYQEDAINELYEADRSLFIGKMGCGKTTTVLTVIDEWLRDGVVDQVFILAPKRVCAQVWPAEPLEWAHLQHMQIQRLVGEGDKRVDLLRTPCRIRVVNFDLIPWLYQVMKKFPPRCAVVIDETSRLKNPRGTWAKTLYKMLERGNVQFRIGMTGTPRPRHQFDLFSQVKLIFGPSVWGSSFDKWRSKNYYKPDPYEEKWEPLPGSGSVIDDTFSRLAFRIPDEKLKRVDVEHTPVFDYVELPLAIRRRHDQALYKWLLDHGDGSDLELLQGAAIGSMKARQITAGWAYDAEGNIRPVHEIKLDTVTEIVEDCGEPCLVAYQFAPERDALMERFPTFGLLGGGVTDRDADRYARLWNDGNLDGIVIHPASAGHGLNIQFGGSRLIWASLPWSLEEYQQTIKRLARQGQKEQVFVHHLLARDTIDFHQYARLVMRDGEQEELVRYIRQIGRTENA